MQARNEAKDLSAESIIEGMQHTKMPAKTSESRLLRSTKICAGPLEHVLPGFFRNAEQVSAVTFHDKCIL